MPNPSSPCQRLPKQTMCNMVSRPLLPELKRALFAGLHKVHRTDETGVMGADHMTQLNRVIQVLDVQADKTFLPVSASTYRVTWRGIPAGRCDHLIIRNLAVPDAGPMPQASPCSIDQTIAIGVHAWFRTYARRLVEPLEQLQ